MSFTVEQLQEEVNGLIAVGLIKKGTKLPGKDLEAAALKFKELVVAIDPAKVQGNEQRTRAYNGVVSKDAKWGGSGIYEDVDAEFPDPPDEGDNVADGSPPTEDEKPEVEPDSGGEEMATASKGKGKTAAKKSAAKKSASKTTAKKSAAPAVKKAASKRGRPPANFTVVLTSKKLNADEKVAPQAQGILDALAGLKNGCSRQDLFKRMEKTVKSKQPMERIYGWYRNDLLGWGLITEKEIS